MLIDVHGVTPALRIVRNSWLKPNVLPSARFPVELSAVAPMASLPPVTPPGNRKYIGRSATNVFGGVAPATVCKCAETLWFGPTSALTLIVVRLLAARVYGLLITLPVASR